MNNFEPVLWPEYVNLFRSICVARGRYGRKKWLVKIRVKFNGFQFERNRKKK